MSSLADMIRDHDFDDENTRQALLAYIESMDDSEREVLSETLSATDVELVKVIYDKLKSQIHGTVLLSFAETRRQLKAIQRELADLRKQVDRIQKEESEENKKIHKGINEIRRLIEGNNEKVARNITDLARSVEKTGT